VRTTGRYFPDDPAEGETLARVEPQEVTPERRPTVTVQVRRGPGWLACFVAPDTGLAPGAPDPPATGGTAVLLFHPDPEEMKLR
jgi:hypothetical protein